MRKLSKKSKIFAFGLVLVLLIVLLRVFFLVKVRKDDLAGDFAIGANQMNLYRAIQNADTALLYGDEAFSLSFQQSLYDISAGGGYSSAPKCGEFAGTHIWRAGSSTECYPDYEDMKNQLSQATLSKLSTYLAKNPYGASSETNHELFLKQEGDKLVGRAYSFSPASQNIMCKYKAPPLLDFGWFELPYVGPVVNVQVSDPIALDTKGICGRYYYKPDFRKEANFDLDDFNKAVSAAKTFSGDVENCIKDDKSPRVCVQSKLKDHESLSKECVGGIGNVFAKFAEFYRSTLELGKNNCVALFNPPHKIDVADGKEIRIKIEPSGAKTRISAVGTKLSYTADAAGPLLTQYYNNPEHPSEAIAEIEYVLTYDDNGKLAGQELNMNGVVDWDITGTLYVHKEPSGRLAFVDTDDYSEFNPVATCFPKREDTFTFCYDTGSKIMAYDPEINALSIRPVRITFALSFPEEKAAEEPEVENPPAGPEAGESS